MEYKNKSLELIEMPQIRFGNPDVTVGNFYTILDIEGSNFWLMDDSGHKTSIGSCRFNLNKNKNK